MKIDKESLNYFKMGNINITPEFIQFDQDPAEDYYKRGLFYLNQDFYDKAIINFNKAISISPAKSNYYFQRGLALFKLKNLESALKDFYKCLDYKHEVVDELNANSKIGIICGLLNDYNGSIKAFKRNIELMPDNGFAYYNIALTYERLGDDKKFIDNMCKSAELNFQPAIDFLNNS